MIRVDISKCTGCHRCETACAFYHTGRINNSLSRIKVMNLYKTGTDGPVVCVQCEEHSCMCCPENAMGFGDQGQIIVSPTSCTSCGVCEKACPIGAIEIFNSIVFVCDLCGGKPKCVEACTEGALVYDPDTKEHPSLADIQKYTKRMNPSQKRRHYIHILGTALREHLQSDDRA
jgi:Fe-S-cluster-containing hydrogenase component 2